MDEIDQNDAPPPRKRRRWLPWRRNADPDAQIEALSTGILLYPDSAVNYVLRGELFEAQRQYHLAAADFEKALELSLAQVGSMRWGLVAQVTQDRAMMGLRRVTNSE